MVHTTLNRYITLECDQRVVEFSLAENFPGSGRNLALQMIKRGHLRFIARRFSPCCVDLTNTLMHT